MKRKYLHVRNLIEWLIQELASRKVEKKNATATISQAWKRQQSDEA